MPVGVSRAVRRVVAVLAGTVVVSQAVAVPTAGATDGAIRIAPSSPRVAFGEQVTISGSLTADGACVGGRSLLLEWRRIDASSFDTVAQGSAASDGTFTFVATEPYTGAYQVTAPADGPCASIVSRELIVRVRARVAATAVGSTVAGTCPEVSVTVEPPKPGHEVELERRSDHGWTLVASLVLDVGSRATASICFAWADVGTVRLRARWPAQDPLNDPATGVVPLRVVPAGWMRSIQELAEGRSMSVSVGVDGTFLYGVAPDALRTPASNEKLLLSMALLDAFGADFRMRTIAASAADATDGVLEDDLWILGRGDPELDRDAIRELARRIRAAGIRRVEGQVLGSTTYFRRDWDAPGWQHDARDYVARPTALTFEGNLTAIGRDERSPETRAAEALAEALEERGVEVSGRTGTGPAPPGLTEVASVRSRPLAALLAALLRPSDNFYAEVLGKRLGAETAGAPGTIAKAAAALSAWVRDRGIDFTLNDASGLSYANRVTAEGIVRLLWTAEDAPWGEDLFRALPTGGQGTLRERLRMVDLRAKTGTLTGISALSGWVWLERAETWAAFSILSRGMLKPVASDLEDRIVRLIQNRAMEG